MTILLTTIAVLVLEVHSAVWELPVVESNRKVRDFVYIKVLVESYRIIYHTVF
jgi:hypothetical protein